MFLQHGKGKFVNFVLKVVTNKDFWCNNSLRWKKPKFVLIESILGKENSSDSLLTNILYHDWAEKNETIVQNLHKLREIKLQIVKEGHCREKRRSKRLSIKQHGHACIRSWYQRAKESHCNPSDMLWLISSDSHAYSENLVASRASFMIDIAFEVNPVKFASSNKRLHYTSLVPLIVLLLVHSTLSCMQIKSLFASNVNAHSTSIWYIKSLETWHYKPHVGISTASHISVCLITSEWTLYLQGF